jgi:hypothetical protein
MPVGRFLWLGLLCRDEPRALWLSGIEGAGPDLHKRGFGLTKRGRITPGVSCLPLRMPPSPCDIQHMTGSGQDLLRIA